MKHFLARRELLKAAGLSTAGLSFGQRCVVLAYAADAHPSPAGELAPLNRLPRMLQEYFVERVREVERAAEQRRAAKLSAEEREFMTKQIAEIKTALDSQQIAQAWSLITDWRFRTDAARASRPCAPQNDLLFQL